jgi:hypothetical protein
MEFIRFGGLSLVNQKGYNSSMPSFHSPPTRKGIYAFNLKTIEPFLLGGYGNKLQWVKDKSGNPIEQTDENYEIMSKAFPDIKGDDGKVIRWGKDRNFYKQFDSKKKGDKFYYSKLIKPKRFFYIGEIWHHLNEFVGNHQILTRKGSWVLTDIDAYEKAFIKQVMEHKFEWTQNKGNINEPLRSGPANCFSKDHFEVFISNKV